MGIGGGIDVALTPTPKRLYRRPGGKMQVLEFGRRRGVLGRDAESRRLHERALQGKHPLC
jgi:hypothetical protein